MPDWNVQITGQVPMIEETQVFAAVKDDDNIVAVLGLDNKMVGRVITVELTPDAVLDLMVQLATFNKYKHYSEPVRRTPGGNPWPVPGQ